MVETTTAQLASLRRVSWVSRRVFHSRKRSEMARTAPMTPPGPGGTSGWFLRLVAKLRAIRRALGRSSGSVLSQTPLHPALMRPFKILELSVPEKAMTSFSAVLLRISRARLAAQSSPLNWLSRK